MRTLLVVAAIMVGTAATAAPPIIVSAPAETSATIHFADIDLASSNGQRQFKRRLASAIEEVCGSYMNVVEPTEEQFVTSCRHDAAGQANRQLAMRLTTIRLAWSAPR